MRIIEDQAARSALVLLVDEPDGIDVFVTDDVVAVVGEDGTVLALDLMNTPEFGTPFDEAAAERAVAWVRDRLAAGEAS